ncbi:hypothetical protein ILYODFUR_032783 [Ilyodon furcidens]|uniref:Uncharacterized protein n=1 Tax=Ilyodon furcidens TaxID=33524 RepID=A0ABV0V826_9TELE
MLLLRLLQCPGFRSSSLPGCKASTKIQVIFQLAASWLLALSASSISEPCSPSTVLPIQEPTPDAVLTILLDHKKLTGSSSTPCSPPKNTHLVPDSSFPWIKLISLKQPCISAPRLHHLPPWRFIYSHPCSCSRCYIDSRFPIRYGFPSVSLTLTRQKRRVLVAGSEPSRCARATGELR